MKRFHRVQIQNNKYNLLMRILKNNSEFLSPVQTVTIVDDS